VSAPRTVSFPERVTNRARHLTAALPDAVRPAVAALLDRPGKRLRSRLMEAAAGFGASANGRLERTGAVVELIHVASLLHDDIVDQSDHRRGQPSAHTRFGTELANLAGLSCFAAASMEAADLGPGTARVAANAASRLAYGQLLDLERAFDTTLTVDDYLELAARKTAELFRLSARLGVAESRCAPATARTVVDISQHIGVAFQLLDDCLDLDGRDTGKPRGTDLARGLFGAPIVHALLRDTDRSLARALCLPDLTPDHVDSIASQVRRLGGLDAATNQAHAYLRQAADKTMLLPAGDARDAVSHLIDTIANQ